MKNRNFWHDFNFSNFLANCKISIQLDHQTIAITLNNVLEKDRMNFVFRTKDMIKIVSVTKFEKCVKIWCVPFCFFEKILKDLFYFTMFIYVGYSCG